MHEGSSRLPQRLQLVRMAAVAALVATVAGCSGDGGATGPSAKSQPGVVLATGTDPVSGASITTSQDDYVPGELVHVTGSGWAPNEVVHLDMSEDPDTHPDVTMDVTADSTGAFSQHFYDVVDTDLGVTFTLTATGGTSGSVAVVVFTDATSLKILGADNTQHLNSASEENLGSITLGASLTLTCPRGNGLTASASGLGQSSLGWTLSYAGSVLNNATLAPLTTLSPSSGVFNSSSDQVCVALSIATPTLTVATTYHGFLHATGSSASDGDYYFRFTVSAASNTAPTVDAGADATINEGSAFTQNGSFTDPDANVWTATVDYDDGTGAHALTLVGKDFTLNHIYPDNGNHTVTVSVSDGTATSTDQVGVTVNNVAPVVSAGADANIAGGGTFSQAGSFTDPGADTWTATVDYGDGSGTQALALTGKTFNLSHTYASSGSYTVTVTVNDDDTGTSSDQVTVNVGNNGPVVSAGADATINEGDTFSQGGSFTDPDANSWTATVDYGDGSGVQSLALSGKTFTLSHTYTDNGDFTVTVSVNDGTATGSDDLVVHVHNVAPTVSAGADATVDEGSAFIQAGSFTDPGADTWTATVDWDDGTGAHALTLVGKTFTLNHTYPDNGNHTVTVTVTDDDSDAGSDQVTVHVLNVAPVVDAGSATATVNEGSAFTRSGSFTDPGADTWTATVDYDDGTGPHTLTLTGKTFTLSHTYPDNGSHTVTVTVNDDDSGSGSDEVTVTVLNVDPVVSAGNDATIDEGSTFSQNGSFTDPGADTWTATVDYGDGSGSQSLILSGKTFSLSHTYTDNGNYTVTVTVTDDDNGSGSDQVIVHVNNVPPHITTLNVPLNPVATSTPVTVTWAFTDPGADAWTCEISWDTGLSFESASYVPTKSCNATKTLAAGIYTVTVKVTDDDGGSDSMTATTYVVVYDPNGGFVTGGGWINSPAGSYTADASLSGKATFGFVSKYVKGANTPTGNTEFQFHAAGMNFSSTSYQWLVVSGALAQYKGDGTVNGVAGYGFLLSATDGQVNGGGGVDKFRIKVIRKSDSVVIYDNNIGAADDAAPTTAITGGSIVVHK